MLGLRLRRLATSAVLVLAGHGVASAAHPAAAAGRGGAVASADARATEIGLALLARGGSAADAAVGTALALAVVHPAAGNLGGGGFAVVRFDGEVEALDFRETAPAAARRDTYLGPDGEPVPDASLVGPLAAGVPGSPVGLFELHRRHGRLAWTDVVRPAERLARSGFPASRRLAASLAARRELLARFPETAETWLPAGRPPREGERIRLPALARTLRAYARRGPEAITRGETARAVEAAAARHGGILTADDLAAYRAAWREPVRFRLAGWEVASMPLPSSGGLILATAGGLAERCGIAAAPRFGARRAHLLAEAWRQSYADRFLLGDPTTVRLEPSALHSARRLDGLAPLIPANRARPSSELSPGLGVPSSEAAETTHLSVIDADGNAVALTTTLNGSFGCGLLVPEAGFLLNNEMDDFATVPGRPNLYGLVQGEANAVAAGKRMLSSMSPTVAWRGEEVLALGSPGGSRIPTATLQVLLHVVLDGDELQAAVNRPRIHHQWLPDELVAEPDALSPETRQELSRRGHRLAERRSIGEVHAVRRRQDGTSEAAADPRGPGAAAALPAPPGHR